MSYEFSDTDATTIKVVGQLAFYIAVLIGFGGLIMMYSALTNQGNSSLKKTILAIQGFLQVVGAWVFLRPSDNLKRVADTSGRDITELMISVEEMSLGFMIAVIIIGISMLLDIVLIAMEG